MLKKTLDMLISQAQNNPSSARVDPLLQVEAQLNQIIYTRVKQSKNPNPATQKDVQEHKPPKEVVSNVVPTAEDIERWTCPICRCLMVQPVRTPCKHMFCVTC